MIWQKHQELNLSVINAVNRNQRMKRNQITIGTFMTATRSVSAAEHFVCTLMESVIDMENVTVNILGTEYTIETHKISEDNVLKDNHYCGYCCDDEPLIVIADTDDKEYFEDYTEKEKQLYISKTLRHEITHAFFNESGLQSSANTYDKAWSRNEEMVDWFAIQSPKIFKAFQELDIL